MVRINLLRRDWQKLDTYELRLLLDKHVGGPGQYDDGDEDPNLFYLPQARESCQVVLTFGGGRIVRIECGPAFDHDRWKCLSEDVAKAIDAAPTKVGRDYGFSTYQVTGSWRGSRSGVQILPAPKDAPSLPAQLANGDHPFILEFPLRATEDWKLTNYRRIREHRKLTLLLSVLLVGGTSLPPLSRSEHLWALVQTESGNQIKWVQRYFFAPLGSVVQDALSAPQSDQIVEVEPDKYYSRGSRDGVELQVPSNLDVSICQYFELVAKNREKIDRAAYWLDVASHQWVSSASTSFAALVSAAESLTERGKKHPARCETCNVDLSHEVPGPTENFRRFFERYVPGAPEANQRNKMYDLRSGILHGSDLMQLDLNTDFGWDPPGADQLELHRQLWRLMRMAARNWLKDPPTSD